MKLFIYLGFLIIFMEIEEENMRLGWKNNEILIIQIKFYYR